MKKNFSPHRLVQDQLNLKDYIVVISGGGGFLGLYFAEAVAEFGAIPILLDINQNRINKNLNTLNKNNYIAYGYECDVSKLNNIDKIINKIIDKFEKVDVLINATNFVGINPSNFKDSKNPYFENFEDYSQDLWQQSIDLNLTATFLLCQKIGKIMLMNESGSIINIASDVGVISPDHRIYKSDKKTGYKGVGFNTPLSYSVSKAGVIHMTKYLATYWAEKGIRVNSISPAGVKNDHASDFQNKLTNLIPMGRMAFPEELKGPIVFLSSNASSFITGSNLIVDGGRTIW